MVAGDQARDKQRGLRLIWAGVQVIWEKGTLFVIKDDWGKVFIGALECMKGQCFSALS